MTKLHYKITKPGTNESQKTSQSVPWYSNKRETTTDTTVPRCNIEPKKILLQDMGAGQQHQHVWADPVEARGAGFMNTILFNELKPDNKTRFLLLPANQQDTTMLISKQYCQDFDG